MKKKILIISFFCLVLITLLIVRHVRKPQAAYTIGILQTASHPALDAARDGFMQELSERLGASVAYSVQNAQGSVAQAHALAQQFHARSDITACFAIATPAAQALYTVEQERPLFIAAVTDPDALLGTSKAQSNVTGTKDMIDVPSEIDMLVALAPETRTVGLLYTSGEPNSLVLVQKMREELAQRNISTVDYAIGNEADIPALVETACRNVDTLLAPTDNTVALTASLIASIALKNNKPFFVSDNMLVRFGALAARGVDYYESGKQTARIAYAVLTEHKKASDFPIQQTETKNIYINQATLQALDLTVPDALQDTVIFV